MYSKSYEIEIMINDKVDDIIEELSQSLLSRHQIGLEKSVKGGDIIFECVHLLQYKCRKINYKFGGSHIDSSDWIKSQKATINPFSIKDNKYFKNVLKE